MGLGKTGEGRLFPVELSNQSGRKGLGFEPHSKGRGYEGKPYNPDLEEVVAEEKIVCFLCVIAGPFYFFKYLISTIF